MTMNKKRVAAYLTICEPDFWHISDWLNEIERLQIKFAVHFDRCSVDTKRAFTYSTWYIGSTSQDDPKVEYTEHDKQRAFDILVTNGYQWGLQLDADETLEKSGKPKLLKTLLEQEDAGADCVGLRYVTLWDDREHIRVDGPFSSGYHVKLYNLQEGRKWKFSNPTVNGAYIQGRAKGNYKETKCDLVCLNHGAMTHELRLLHKERWDRIYGAISGNPYGFWSHSLDYANYPPVVVENPY